MQFTNFTTNNTIARNLLMLVNAQTALRFIRFYPIDRRFNLRPIA